MKICLVSAFPPSRRGLNEYGYHIAKELRQDPLLSLTVLADEFDSPQPEVEGFDVVRCWSFDKLSNPLRLLKTIRDVKPDVVWFNLLFSTFGNSPVAAFAGLSIPAMMRLSGFYTHVTLHHLMDNIDLGHAGVRFPRAYRVAGRLATRMLLMANSVSVLLPAYRRTLMERYGGENVHFRAHGILSARPEMPDFAQRGNPHHRILPKCMNACLKLGSSLRAPITPRRPATSNRLRSASTTTLTSTSPGTWRKSRSPICSAPPRPW
jgi:hypothetical protein